MRLAPRLRQDDQGFSLVESLVGLGIATVTLLGLLGSSMYAVGATVTSRQNQQAADFLNEALEAARSIEYGALTMVTSDLVGDPAIAGTPAAYDHDGDAATAPERVDAAAVGSIAPHLETRSTPNGTYRIGRYVTVPPTAVLNAQGVPSSRRLTVVISWTKQGKTRTRRSGTILTHTRRGLALPYYTFRYNGPAPVVGGVAVLTKNPGNEVEYGLVLRNQGARDAWTLTASTSGWRYYRDTNQDGLWEGDASEPELTGASTGLLEPASAPLYVVAHRVSAATEPLGSTTTTFSATPASLTGMSPVPTGAVKTVPTRLDLVSGAATPATPAPAPSASSSPPPCNPGTGTSVTDPGTGTAASTPNSHTLTRLFLYNGPSSGDTVTQPRGTMSSSTAGLQSQLCNWSTEQGTGAGRSLTSGAAAPSTVAEWRFTPATKSEDDFAGNAVLVVHVRCSAATTLTAQLASVTTAGVRTDRTAAASVGLASCPTSGFQRYDIALPLTAPFTVNRAAGEQLSVTVTSSAAVRLAHGLTSPSSRLVIGMR